MVRYIALLRGINVAGKTVKMAELRALFESMRFKNVKTYIQSGNVVFEAADEIDTLEDRLASELQQTFGFPIPVVIRTLPEWKEVIRKNPFADGEPYVSFLSEKPSEETIEKVKSYNGKSDDEIQILGREVYLLCKGSYHKTLYSNAFLEKKLGVSATTRNWKTVNKLHDLAQGD